MREGSDGSYVLSERDLIVMSSINCKMYNRFRSGNILLATAMQRLHFEKFLKDFKENMDESVLEK